MLYIRFQRVETDKRRSMTKKGHQKFSALKWKFFPKRIIRSVNCFSVLPKLGAKSPPMILRTTETTGVVTYTSIPSTAISSAAAIGDANLSTIVLLELRE